MKEWFRIFFIFAKIGATTFGGGYSALPVMQHELVDRQGFLSEEELTDYYALAQCLPGLIFINCAVLIMRPRRGLGAAWAAALGIAFPSLLIILLIASLLYRFMDLPIVIHAFNGIRVAVAATVLHSAWRLVKSGVTDWLSALIFLAALILLLVGVNPIPIILGTAVVALITRMVRSKKDPEKGGDRA